MQPGGPIVIRVLFTLPTSARPQIKNNTTPRQIIDNASSASFLLIIGTPNRLSRLNMGWQQTRQLNTKIFVHRAQHSVSKRAGPHLFDSSRIGHHNGFRRRPQLQFTSSRSSGINHPGEGRRVSAVHRTCSITPLVNTEKPKRRPARRVKPIDVQRIAFAPFAGRTEYVKYGGRTFRKLNRD